jgi:Transposase DDE domain
VFIRTQTNGSRTYLLLVENARVNGRPVQRVLHRLGRLDQLRASGQLDALVASLGRLSEKLLVLDAHAHGESLPTATVTVGPAVIFERLWRESGIADVLATLLAPRRFDFDVERAIFLTVLHRVMAPGSDRAAERWKADYRIPGAEDLQLHQLYRAMAWLGEPLPKAQQTRATPFAPRTTKDLIEEALFARRRDLFSTLDLVFFDTTSLYFHGAGGATLGHHGHSRDHRPDLKQMVVGMVVDGEGRPVCTELWPGNVTDVTTLIPIVDRLKQTFHVPSVCVVADRGMISAETMAALEARDWAYILGVRMRSSIEAQAVAAAHTGRYREVFGRRTRSHDPAPLKVKEIWRGARRYVVCLNVEDAAHDQRNRTAIVAALEKALTQGDKALVGNKGFRRFLKTQGARFAIDHAKIATDARYDGKWVLRTNTDLATPLVALAYKHLWMVEAMFRSMKAVLETRPIYHQHDQAIRGHVFCSFLALVLRQDLERRLAQHGATCEWADIIRDLDHLQETTITVEDKPYVIRSAIKGTLGNVFAATGVAIPPTLHPA